MFRQPSAGSQLSVVQTLLSLQFGGVAAAQLPLWQASSPSHAWPSLQEVPFATGVALHPEAGVQPSVVHGLPSLHTSAVPAVQEPLWQVSEPLQRFPSLHEEPLATATFWQPTEGLQLSFVHG